MGIEISSRFRLTNVVFVFPPLLSHLLGTYIIDANRIFLFVMIIKGGNVLLYVLFS